MRSDAYVSVSETLVRLFDPIAFCSVRTMNLRFLSIFLLSIVMCRAAAPSPEVIKTVAERYLAKQEAPILEKGFGMDEALRTQTQFVELLKPKLGPVAGYKIGLITKAGQERFGSSGPVHGVLLKKMLSHER